MLPHCQPFLKKWFCTCLQSAHLFGFRERGCQKPQIFFEQVVHCDVIAVALSHTKVTCKDIALQIQLHWNNRGEMLKCVMG